MSWPLSQDYNEAIQSPKSNFADPDLRRGEAVCSALGIPMPYSGNFADVYQVRCPDGSRWAVKCFTRQAEGLRERYHEISKHLSQAKLPFTVDFTYLEKGMRVAGTWYPVLKMQWVEGLTLNQFVGQYLDKAGMLEGLLQIWGRMGKCLREAEAAHCDLQHGNVLLVPGASANSLALKLIDYDGMWVPALAGTKSGEVGHPSYQHPRRLKEGTYSIEVDRFPLLLVATSLRALKLNGKGLWEKHDNGDNLLFKEADLREPTKSHLFLELIRSSDPQTAALAEHLFNALRGGLETTPLLEEVMPETRPAPTTSSRPSRLAPTAGAKAAAPTSPPVAPVAPLAPVAPVAAGALDFDEPAPNLNRPTRKRTKTKPGVPRAVWIGAAAAAVLLLGLAGGLAAWAMSGPPNDTKQGAPATPVALTTPTGATPQPGPVPPPNKDEDEPSDPNPPGPPGAPPPEPGSGAEPPVVPIADRFPLLPGGTGAVRVEGDILVLDDLYHVPACANIFFGNTEWTDYDFQVEAKRLAGTTHCALWFRQADPGNHWCYSFGKGSHLVTLENQLDAVWRGGIQQDVGPIGNDDWYTLRVSVRGSELRCFVDGRPTFTETRQAHPQGCVGLHANGSRFAFRNIKVTAPDGKVLLAGLPDLSPPAPPTPVAMDPVPPPAKQPAERLAAPDDTALTDADNKIKEDYKGEYAKKKPEDVKALAAKLFQEGLAAKDGPAAQFVLLRESRDLSARAGDMGLALRAADELAARFSVGAVEMRTQAFEEAGRAILKSEVRANVAALALAYAEDAMDTDDYAMADRLSKAAQAAAASIANKSLEVVFQRRVSEVGDLRTAYESVKDAAKTLATKPDDPDANLALGKFFCLDKGDWDRGLPMLALGSDAKLKELAGQEAASPADAAMQDELGNDYAALAKEESGARKLHLLRRARYWYAQAEAGLTALPHTEVVKKIAEIDKTAPAGPPEVLFAAYGHNDVWADLTAQVRALLVQTKDQKLSLKTGAGELGIVDPAPTGTKSLVVVYRYDERVRLSITGDGSTANFPAAWYANAARPAVGQALTILYARYGVADDWPDATAKAQELVEGATLTVRPEDLGVGVPAQGRRKALVVVSRKGGRVRLSITGDSQVAVVSGDESRFATLGPDGKMLAAQLPDPAPQPGKHKPTHADLVGVWRHGAGGGKPGEITLLPNGRIKDAEATWTFKEMKLTFRWLNAKAPGGAWIDECTVSEDGTTYRGANQNGVPISGVKISDLPPAKP